MPCRRGKRARWWKPPLNRTSSNTIDLYLFAAMKDAGVAPAEKSTDLEFIRRVTLDLTSRIPTPDRVVSFVADSAPDKRAKLVDSLMAPPSMRRTPPRSSCRAAIGCNKPRTCCGRCLTKWISSTTIEARNMSPQEKFQRFVTRYPHPRRPFYARPHFTRRQLFQIFGAGVTATCMIGKPAPAGVVVNSNPVSTQNTAKNVIFILMAGAPSHTDTFDLKVVDGVTPGAFNPTDINGINWPVGLLPKLAGQLPNLAVVRSAKAWATGHSISQSWVQIG